MRWYIHYNKNHINKTIYILKNIENSKKIKTAIDYWKKQNEKRKCTDFLEMSYWEVVSTNSAL